MPDTTGLLPVYGSRLVDDPATADDLIRRERRPLPPHDLDGVNYRRWAAAVCQAEVDHADADFWRVVHRHKYAITIDRFREPDAAAAYRVAHEAHAGAALNWLSHLQTHDSDRHGPWARWNRWDYGHRVWWVLRRRTLVHGWLRCMRAYHQARALVEQQEAA